MRPVLLVLLALSVTPQLVAQEAGPDPREVLAPVADELSRARTELRKLSDTLAKSGSARAVQGVLDEFWYLGAEEQEYERQRERLVKALDKARPPRSARAAERQLEKDLDAVAEAAEVIAEAASTTDGAVREALFASALRLDGGCVAAREGLGHVKEEDGVWRSARESRMHAFREAFAAELLRARQMHFELEDLEPLDDLLVGCAQEPVHAVGFEGVRLEGEMPRAGLARRLTDVLRASAFAHWLTNGTLEPSVGPFSIVVQPSGEPWRRYAEAAQGRGLIDATELGTTLAVTGSWQIPMRRGGDFAYWYASNTKESVVETFFKVDRSLLDGNLARGDWDKLWKATSPHAPYWMCAGLVNLAGLSVLDEEWNVLPFEPGSPADGSAVTAAGDEMTDLRYRALLPGLRAWMADEVEAGRELDIMACLRARPADLNSRLLVQLTTMVEFLATRDGLPAVLARFREVTGGEDVSSASAMMAAIEPTLGQPVDAFVEEWKAWLLAGGEEPSVRGLLLADPSLQVDEGDTDAWLEALNTVRFAAQGGEVFLDEDLSATCREWARELDAGAGEPTTPEAAWAMLHSVWSADAEDPMEQVLLWMGTVYLRVPLIMHTVGTVGIATAGDAVVVDATTMRHMSGRWLAHWPPHESREIPVAYTPLGPNPVPGEDMEEMGFPATLTLSEFYGEPLVEMTLTGPDGPVDCWFSSPLAPLNPDHVLPGTYALIPKAPLEGGRQYDVIARWGIDSEVRWTFITD